MTPTSRAARSSATPAASRPGVLKDNAMELVGARCRRRPTRSNDRALDAAMKYVAAQGVTSVHHMGTWEDLGVFERALARRPADDAHLRRRAARDVGAAARHGGGEALGAGRARRRVAHASARSRDSSTARSARTRRRSSSRSPTRRRTAACSSTRRRICTRGFPAPTRRGLHVIVHAIGDRANRTQLDIFERVAQRERPARPALPHRARAAHRARGHSALRRARRHRQHAAVSRDRRRAVGGEGDRPRTQPDDVRVPVAARCEARGSRSAATGSSRRRRRSRGSTPP